MCVCVCVCGVVSEWEWERERERERERYWRRSYQANHCASMLPQSTIPPSGVAVGSITGSPTIVGCLILLHSITLNHMTEYKWVVKLFQRFNHEWLLAKPESLRYSQITNIYTRLWIIQGNFMNKYLRSKLCLTYCSFFCQEMLACWFE